MYVTTSATAVTLRIGCGFHGDERRVSSQRVEGMGIDDTHRSRGQAPRRSSAYEASEPSAGRSYSRGQREDAPRPRSRGPEDGPRSGSYPRYEPGGPRSRPDQSSSSGRRVRPDYADGRGPRRDDYTSGGARAQRPRPQGDFDATAARPRRPRDGAPMDSGARPRRPNPAGAQGRGGLWNDQASVSTRAQFDPRDPRSRRPGAGRPIEDEEESSGGAGKAMGAIVLALLVGAGAAYGYYVVSAPKLNVDTAPATASPTATGKSGHVAAPIQAPSLSTTGAVYVLVSSSSAS